MDMNEVRAQVLSTKNKLFDGEVTMLKKDFAFIIAISVLVGMIMGLCKKMRTSECKCKKCKDKEDKGNKQERIS